MQNQLSATATLRHTLPLPSLSAGKLPAWKDVAVPAIAKKYWRLDPDASMRDLLLVIRADELCHAHVNAVFANMPQSGANPFAPGTSIVA